MAKSKKPKKIDRISNLPDSILCHILAFLPTRASMATSILSRRWRHLWKDLQVLDIDHDQFRVEQRFIDFVDAVLARCNSPQIRKFRFSCELSESRVLDEWSSAIGPHLQELRLSLAFFDDTDWDLPPGVFTSKSLVSLVLKGCVDLNYHRPIQDFHLPSLKNLEVDVCIANLDKVLSGCPVVENLKLVLHKTSSSRISIPRSLKRLTLEEGDDAFFDLLEIDIDTPSLEYLNLFVGQFLLRAPALEFPEFRRLVHLELGYYFNGRILLEFLQNCNMLQTLIIHTTERGGWTPPIKAPNCMISSLKTFEFDGHLDSEDERAFISYVLQEGLV